MNTLKRWTIFPVLFLIFTTPLKGHAGERRLSVVASLFPLYEFARHVGGDMVEVTPLLPPGAEPHTWGPKPSDITRISRADIFVYMGREMEPWVSKVLDSITGKEIMVLEASRGLDLLGARGQRNGQPIGTHDPHVWLDFQNSRKIVDAIADEFSKADPSGSDSYRTRANEYNGQLATLDQYYSESLKNCRKRVFIFGGHAAFGYLADRYNLIEVPVYGISPDSEPSPRKVAGIIETIRTQDLDVVYFEDLVNPRLAQVIADETGAETLALNPGGNLTSDQWKAGVTFISLMRENLGNLMKGMDCE